MTDARPKLTASQAAALARADDDVAGAKAKLEEAETKRTELRTRYRCRIADADQAGECEVGGYRVKISRVDGRRTFRLKDFLAKHRPTKSMQPFMGTGRPYDVWTVTPTTERTARRAAACDRAS